MMSDSSSIDASGMASPGTDRAAGPHGEVLLSLVGLTKRFGGFTALNDVSIDVRSGEIHAVIGPNGAGKTTLFNLVSGILRHDGGRILFEGQPIDRLRPYQRTLRGVSRTFQNIRLFHGMTVLENVMVAQHGRHYPSITSSFASAILGRGAKNERMKAVARDLLAFVELERAADAKATDLPYGQRRLLEIARALATEPKLILLDEPAAGMNPRETEGLDKLISKLSGLGITTLLVEHDMNLVMGISDRVTVLNFGEKIAEGLPEEVQNNEEVVAAYLGTDDEI